MELLSRMKEVLDGMRAGDLRPENPWQLLGRYTSVMDGLVLELYDTVVRQELPHIALVAVGGYGRGELSPWSDVDLMFLCHDTSSRGLVRTVSAVLHILWDLHLEVGHSVRSVADCEEVALRDLKTWTALMDARLVAGDGELFSSFERRVKEDLLRSRREEFVRRLMQAVWERHKRYSISPFLVEPHLKEGPGGLRDLQSALWLGRCRFPVHDLEDFVDHALVSHDEAQEVRDAQTFLWKTRLELHRLAMRKEDHLTFGLQEKVAQSVALGKEREGLRVESFMRLFYRHAMRIRSFVEDLIQKATDPSLASGPDGPTAFPEELGGEFFVARGRLTLLDERAFQLDPARIMEVLAYVHKEGLELDIFTRDEIKGSLHLVDDHFRKSPRARNAFLSMLEGQDCGHKALELMHRLGLLQAYIPEFGSICFQVQHDAYHAYTTDTHSLETVRELAAIRQKASNSPEDLSSRVAREVEGWSILSLAALLHDVGKGEGPGHAERGAAIVERILRRWRLPKSDRERVVFLVREHLLLMDTALGRDLTEEKVIADVCARVGSVNRLNDLYLLTLADLRGTGPELLTDWKDQLLRELYLKTRHLLETGEIASPEADKRVQEAGALLHAALKGRMTEEELERWIEGLPGRYLLTTPREDLADQSIMALEMIQAKESLRVAHRSRNGYREFVVCTWDAPALFSRICGVLVAHGINILGARIHTWSNGIVMDSFQVEPLGRQAPMDPHLLDRVARDLSSVLKGSIELDQLLAKMAPAPHVRPERHPAIPPQVRIDNHSSDFYTVVEVRAADRFGLLFSVTRTLAELKFDIHLALIDTRRGQVFDVFYVQEMDGQKVWNPERVAEMERGLYCSLERLNELWSSGQDGRSQGRCGPDSLSAFDTEAAMRWKGERGRGR
jgi:[protein-PII] uridylyltransferase